MKHLLPISTFENLNKVEYGVEILKTIEDCFQSFIDEFEVKVEFRYEIIKMGERVIYDQNGQEVYRGSSKIYKSETWSVTISESDIKKGECKKIYKIFRDCLIMAESMSGLRLVNPRFAYFCSMTGKGTTEIKILENEEIDPEFNSLSIVSVAVFINK